MSKRLISYLLAFAMVFSMMPVQMFAAESYQTVTVDKTTVKVGEDVHITVTVPEIAETVGSIDVRLKFDTDKFEVKSREMPPCCTILWNWQT